MTQEIVDHVKAYINENLPLNQLSDEDLESKIETLVRRQIGDAYVPIRETVSMVGQIYSSIRGLGLLDSILADDSITEVMINGHEHIFIEKNGQLTQSDHQFENQRRLEDVIQRIVGLAGREVNQANPIVDTRLPDGSRVNVVLPPIALCGPTMTIRKFSKAPMTIEKLIEYGSLTEEIANQLELFVTAKYNIFISGGTGSGKTSFLNALSNYIPKTERIITIEDSAELQIKGIDNLVSLETRNANSAGAGKITVRELKRHPVYDKEVILKGKITRRIDKNEYLFDDSTGRMKMYIEARLLSFKRFSETATVEITGMLKKNPDKQNVAFHATELNVVKSK